MRLGSILSKQPPLDDYVQVDPFLLNRQGKTGQQVGIDIGSIMLNYFCSDCNDLRTFQSKGKISCIFVNKQVISIDAVLTCGCGSSDVQIWFLVKCDGDICSIAPKVKIIKRSEKLSDMVKINGHKYGSYTDLLDKADKAYLEGLGAGAMVYLRKAFEKMTVDVANIAKMDFQKWPSGNPKNFSKLLEKVDKEYSIIPDAFSDNGYKLFRELSAVVHGGYDEKLGLEKFKPAKRLVVGILDNLKYKEELKAAISELGWTEEGCGN